MTQSKNKKRFTLLLIIKNLAQLYLNKISNLAQLASLEAQLARKTLATLVFLTLILAFLFISTWMSLLLLLFIYLISLHYSLLFASFIIVLLNLLLFIIISLYMSRIKKNLFFPATRRQLSRLGITDGSDK